MSTDFNFEEIFHTGNKIMFHELPQNLIPQCRKNLNSLQFYLEIVIQPKVYKKSLIEASSLTLLCNQLGATLSNPENIQFDFLGLAKIINLFTNLFPGDIKLNRQILFIPLGKLQDSHFISKFEIFCNLNDLKFEKESISFSK